MFYFEFFYGVFVMGTRLALCLAALSQSITEISHWFFFYLCRLLLLQPIRFECLPLFVLLFSRLLCSIAFSVSLPLFLSALLCLFSVASLFS